MLKRTGPDHDPEFTIGVVIDGTQRAEGQGRAKRAAEQSAAETVLRAEGIWGKS